MEGGTLADALERLCVTTGARHRRCPFPPHRRPRTAGDRARVAPLRVAQSALANTVHDAQATTAEVTLGYLGGRIAPDVVGLLPRPAAPHPAPTASGRPPCAPRERPRRHADRRVRLQPRHRPGRPASPGPAHRARGPPVTDAPVRLLLADGHPVVRAGPDNPASPSWPRPPPPRPPSASPPKVTSMSSSWTCGSRTPRPRIRPPPCAPRRRAVCPSPPRSPSGCAHPAPP